MRTHPHKKLFDLFCCLVLEYLLMVLKIQEKSVLFKLLWHRVRFRHRLLWEAQSPWTNRAFPSANPQSPALTTAWIPPVLVGFGSAEEVNLHPRRRGGLCTLPQCSALPICPSNHNSSRNQTRLFFPLY